MQPQDQSNQVDEKRWALDVKVTRLTNAERAYQKSGVNLVMTVELDGKDVEFGLYLDKSDALDLSAILTAEVSAEIKQWPLGYSDAELDTWRAEIDADFEAEMDAADDQICRLHDEDAQGWAAYLAEKSDVQRVALEKAMKARSERQSLPPAQGAGDGE